MNTTVTPDAPATTETPEDRDARHAAKAVRDADHEAKLAEEAATTSKARRPRGTKATGDPRADRAPATRKARGSAKTTEPAGDAPAPAAETPAKPEKAPRPTKAEMIAALTEKWAEKIPAGFSILWPHASHSLLKRGEGAAEDAPAWLVLCNEHGTTTPAENAKDGEQKGRRADRAGWCRRCGTASRKAAEAKAAAGVADAAADASAEHDSAVASS